MEKFEFRPRTSAEIIQDSFRLCGDTLATSVSLALVAHLPLLLISGMLAEGRQANPVPLLFSLGIAIVLTGIVLTAITVVQAAALTGASIGAWHGLALAFRRPIRSVVLAYMLSNLVSHLGLLLLVVPGLAAGGLLAAAIPAIIVEGKDTFSGMKRSAGLLSNYWLTGVNTFIFGVLMWEVLPLLAVTGLHVIAGEGPFSPLLAALLGSITMPFALAANLLLYFSARARLGEQGSPGGLREEVRKLIAEDAP